MMMQGAGGPARALTVAAALAGGLGLACLFAFAIVGGDDVDALAGPLPLLEAGIVLTMTALPGFFLALAWQYVAGLRRRTGKGGKRLSRP